MVDGYFSLKAGLKNAWLAWKRPADRHISFSTCCLSWGKLALALVGISWLYAEAVGDVAETRVDWIHSEVENGDLNQSGL